MPLIPARVVAVGVAGVLQPAGQPDGVGERVVATTSRPRPFRLLAAVEGRTDQLLRLPGRDGTRRPVHPVVFHRALELVDAAGWQVRQDHNELTVLVAPLAPPSMRQPCSGP